MCSFDHQGEPKAKCQFMGKQAGLGVGVNVLLRGACWVWNQWSWGVGTERLCVGWGGCVREPELSRRQGWSQE
jgi:hypothetical protein